MNKLNNIMETLHQAEVGAYYFDEAETKLRLCVMDDRVWPLIQLHSDGTPYLQIRAARKGVRYSTLQKLGEETLSSLQAAGIEIDRFSPIRYGY